MADNSNTGHSVAMADVKKYRITGTMLAPDGRMYAVVIECREPPRETRIMAEVTNSEQAAAVLYGIEKGK